jgi:hypothetical protein
VRLPHDTYIPVWHALNFAILSSVLLFLPSQGLPHECFISFLDSYHAHHGIAFSSLTGIAGPVVLSIAVKQFEQIEENDFSDR